VESAQLNAITGIAMLFVTPSLRAQFVSHAPVSPWLSGGFGYGFYEGSSALQNGALTQRFIGTWPIRRGNLVVSGGLVVHF